MLLIKSLKNKTYTDYKEECHPNIFSLHKSCEFEPNFCFLAHETAYKGTERVCVSMGKRRVKTPPTFPSKQRKNFPLSFAECTLRT